MLIIINSNLIALYNLINHRNKMATQSKMIFDSFSALLMKALFGSKRKKIVTASILFIIGFLVHIKNKKTNIDSLRLSKLSIKDAEV